MEVPLPSVEPIAYIWRAGSSDYGDKRFVE